MSLKDTVTKTACSCESSLEALETGHVNLDRDCFWKLKPHTHTSWGYLDLKYNTGKVYNMGPLIDSCHVALGVLAEYSDDVKEHVCSLKQPCMNKMI